MKYLVVSISAAVLLAALVFVGGGYLNGRRADRKAEAQRTAVHSMTQQELAAAVARCDAPPAPGEPRNGAMRRDEEYCGDVAREMDGRSLEIVKVKPPALPLPAPR